jgi:hypothetical protein
MTSAASPPSAPTRAAVVLFAFGMLAWWVATLHFGWLGLAYVPKHTALLRGLGVQQMPLYARLVSVVVPDVLRWAPLVWVGAPIVGLAFFPVVRRLMRLTWWPPARTVQAMTVLALLGTAVTVIASFATVHSVHSVYQRLALEAFGKR